MDFSPDGKTLVTGSWDGEARLWELTSGQNIATLKGEASAVYCIRFSPDGRVAEHRDYWDQLADRREPPAGWGR